MEKEKVMIRKGNYQKSINHLRLEIKSELFYHLLIQDHQHKMMEQNYELESLPYEWVAANANANVNAIVY